MNTFNEGRMFSEALSDPTLNLNEAFRRSSVSDADAQLRVNAYQKMFSNYTDLKEAAKTFADYSDNAIIANQYFDATVAGASNGFAGFLAIERALDKPNGILYYLDLIGATDGRSVLPNLGKQNVGGIKNKLEWSPTIDSADLSYGTLFGGKKLLPGQFKLTVTRANGSKYEFTDDKNGNIVGPMGVLDSGTVTYSTGAFEFEFATGFSLANTDKVVVTAIDNVTAAAGINRFKNDMKEVYIATTPDLLVGETNLVSMVALQKSLGMDPQTIMVNKLQELYTQINNQNLVDCIANNYEGDTFTIDLTTVTNQFQDYRSNTEKLVGEMNEIDTRLAKKSVKGVKATAHLVSPSVATQIKKAKMIGSFTEATSSNINDLVGYLDGIPVLRHDSVEEGFGYAIHKTSDGQLAPVARGLFLPLTNTPTVYNYDNPTQAATGVFYQNGDESVAPELVQKYKIEL